MRAKVTPWGVQSWTATIAHPMPHWTTLAPHWSTLASCTWIKFQIWTAFTDFFLSVASSMFRSLNGLRIESSFTGKLTLLMKQLAITQDRCAAKCRLFHLCCAMRWNGQHFRWFLYVGLAPKHLGVPCSHSFHDHRCTKSSKETCSHDFAEIPHVSTVALMFQP